MTRSEGACPIAAELNEDTIGIRLRTRLSNLTPSGCEAQRFVYEIDNKSEEELRVTFYLTPYAAGALVPAPCGALPRQWIDRKGLSARLPIGRSIIRMEMIPTCALGEVEITFEGEKTRVSLVITGPK